MKKKKSSDPSAKRAQRAFAYQIEFRLRMARLHLEEGYSTGLLREQFGVSVHSIQRWVKAYRLRGTEGLEPRQPLGGRSRLPAEVRQKMVALRQEHPEYRPRRIADLLKRFFLIPPSQATVHKTLTE